MHLSKRNTFSILMFIHRGKKNKNEECPIYCRLTIQGKSREFSTQIWTLDKKWNSAASKIIGNNEFAKTANHTIEAIKTNLYNIRANFQEQGKVITPELVVNTHLGKTERKHTLIEILSYHNEKHVKPLIGKDYAAGTYERYSTSLAHVKKFLVYQYSTNDVALSELNLAFATNYEFYLKTVRGCAHNSAIKYIKNLKSVINFAVKMGWLSANPLNTYVSKLEKVDKGYLSELELQKIENKNFQSGRVSEIRDVFVFCCYTGLAYSDVAKLSKENISIGINGKKHISIKRTKTDILAKIPLLDKALEILEKYSNHPECIYNNRLLPTKSNQKHNEYLKEIAEVCEIEKNLTTHIARHTFATLMLTKKVSMESVSSMLGHTNLKTTQIYAKIVGEKINSEMELVNEKLRSEIKTG